MFLQLKKIPFVSSEVETCCATSLDPSASLRRAFARDERDGANAGMERPIKNTPPASSSPSIRRHHRGRSRDPGARWSSKICCVSYSKRPISVDLPSSTLPQVMNRSNSLSRCRAR